MNTEQSILEHDMSVISKKGKVPKGKRQELCNNRGHEQDQGHSITLIKRPLSEADVGEDEV